MGERTGSVASIFSISIWDNPFSSYEEMIRDDGLDPRPVITALPTAGVEDAKPDRAHRLRGPRVLARVLFSAECRCLPAIHMIEWPGCRFATPYGRSDANGNPVEIRSCPAAVTRNDRRLYAPVAMTGKRRPLGIRSSDRNASKPEHRPRARVARARCNPDLRGEGDGANNRYASTCWRLCLRRLVLPHESRSHTRV